MFDKIELSGIRVKFQSHLLIRDVESGEVFLNTQIDQPCVIYETINYYNRERNILPYRYIGSDWNDNQKYFGSNKKLKEDIEKLGPKWFKKRILFIFNKNEDLDNKLLRKKESDILKLLNVKADDTYYNQTDHYGPGGGKKGMKHAKPRPSAYWEKWKKVREENPVKFSKSSRDAMSLERKGKSWEDRWGKEKATKEREKRKGKQPPNTCKWEVISPAGEMHIVYGLRTWCIENKLNYHRVWSGLDNWKVRKITNV